MPKLKQNNFLVLGELHGEEMHKFRTGAELYPYCKTCVHAQYTPITNVIGCTIGDDPLVIDYSDRLASEETNENAEKCPGFVDRVVGAPGTVAPDSVIASTSNASMVKEVPGELQPHTEDEWHELIEHQLDELPDDFEEERAVIRHSLDELEKKNRETWLDVEQDYDYQGHAVDIITSSLNNVTFESGPMTQFINYYDNLESLVRSDLPSGTGLAAKFDKYHKNNPNIFSNSFAVIAFMGSVIIGWGEIEIRSDYSHLNVFVIPELRRQGIGKKIVQRIKILARDNGFTGNIDSSPQDIAGWNLYKDKEITRNEPDQWLDETLASIPVAMSEEPPMWSNDEQVDFHDHLISLGLNPNTPDAQARSIISHSLAHWRDGLLVPSLTPDLVETVWEGFKETYVV